MKDTHLSLTLLLAFTPAVIAQHEPGTHLPAAVRLYGSALSKSIANAEMRLGNKLIARIDHSTWADPWQIETANIELRSTASYSSVVALAKGQEQMLQSMIELIAPDYDIREPFKVWVFPGLNEYNAHNNSGGADARSSIYASYYDATNAETPVVTYEPQNSTLLRMHITHGLSNALLNRAYPNRNHAAWLDEGLGSYFRLWWAREWSAKQLARLISTNRYIPLARLLDDPVANYTARNAETRFIELGMLFLYLLECREDTRSEIVDEELIAGDFTKYLRTQAQGIGTNDTISANLLSGNRATLEADFKAYDFAAK